MPVRVECESCKSPYTIDERRIPASGLRVRCPKCSTTFVVKRPGGSVSAPPETAPARPPIPAQANPRTAPVAKPASAVQAPGESFAKLPALPPGMPQSSLPPARGGRVGPSSSVERKPADSIDDLPAPTLEPRPAKPVLKGTQLGLGGLVPGIVRAAGVQATPSGEHEQAVAAPPSDQGAEIDLPAPAGSSFGEIDLPATAAKGFGEIDLPAVAPTRAREAAPARAKEVAPRGDRGSFGEIDLPNAGREPFGEVDLPSVSAKKPSPSFGEIDLPSVSAKKPSPSFGEVDLPSVSAKKPSFGEVDLPSVSAKKPAFGEVDLPSVSAKKPAFGEVDLPSVSPKKPSFGEVDLPSVSGGKLDLPSVPGRAAPPRAAPPRPPRAAPPTAPSFDLPAPKGASSAGHGGFGAIDLPSPAATRGGFGEIDLPEVASPGEIGLPAVGSGIELPTPSGVGLPAPAARPPARAADPVSFGPPPLADKGSDFGELELPKPPSGAPGDPWGPRAETKPAGATFGEIDFGDPAPGASAGDPAASFESDFGELELPGPNDAPNAERAQIRGSAAIDSIRPVPFSAPPVPTAQQGAFSAPPAHGPFSGPPPSLSSVAPNAGGMEFGEVDLGGPAADRPGEVDDMEFGAIPQERTMGADVAPMPRPRPSAEKAVEAEPEPRRRGLGKWIGAVFAVAVVGGATLQFDERLGAFGWKAISDRVNAPKHASLTQSAIDRTRAAFADDTLARADQAVAALRADVASAPRHAPLVAYAAFAEFAHELRWGKDATRHAQADAMLRKLAGDAGAKRLAEAARAAVDGDLAAARTSLKERIAADPSDLDAKVTLGEVELRAKAPKEAIAAFEGAIAIADSPRTRAGLMRALLASGDREGARKTAEEILAKAPTHFGAKLLLARDAWLVGRDEAITTKLLGELEAPAVVANAAPNERVSALSLRGLVALSRGRVTDARKAFEEAIRVAQGASTEEPQTGLGEVFLASGQYPQAISAFNAATQAAPESTVAKIGVARALLRQEKASEAKAVLAPLKDPALAGEVGYWLGQAQEKIAPEKPSEAVAIYEAAIKAQPTDPKPYVALASLQAKSGKSAEADATLAQALAKVPPSDRLHLGIGDLRFRQERYDGALEQYDKALALQPENLEALFAKARTLLRMDRGRWEQAKAALDQVEAKDPHYPTLTLELGLYYQKTDQIEKALEKYKAALAGAPDDVDIKLMVARAQVEAHVREAEGDLRAVLDRCGSSATPDVCTNEAKHYLGRALLARGNPVEARQYLQQAVDRGDANAQYHLYLGWAQVELTQLEEAERSIERALELDKGLGNAHWLRAEILSKRGQHREAIDAARRALAITPTRSEAHATIGFGLKQLGLEDQAIAEYALAIKGDPRNPRSAWWRFQIADLHFHKGTTARALDEIRESIKLGKGLEPKPPWLAKAHFFLGEALRGSDKPGAIKAYQEYLETSIGLSDPARKDAKSALAELGAPWTGK